MSYKMNNYALIFCIVAAVLLLHCQNPSDADKDNAKVAGVLYNDNGTRAVGAKVACIPRNHDPHGGTGSHIDSTVTDDTGAYRFDSLPADSFYNVLASRGDNLAYRDSIRIVRDGRTAIPACTLHAAGTIRGRIRLEPGDDPQTVFILFMGTCTFTMPGDTNGSFTTQPMARGKYRVKILTTLPDYDVMDTSLTAIAGKDTTLPQPIRLNYTGIPVPKNLRIEYDTMKQIVTFAWDKPTNGRPVQGYNIYRKHQDSALVLRKADCPDTVYQDSTLIQDITYEYRVSAVDTQWTEGVKSVGINVVAVGAYVLDTAFGTKGTGDGQFYGGSYGIAIAKGGNVFVLDGENERIQVFSPQGIFQHAIPSIPLPQGIYGDLAIDSLSNIYVSEEWDDFVLKLDSSGTPVDTIVGLSDPAALFFNSSGLLLAAERYMGKVVIFDDFLNRVDSISGTFIVHDMVQDGDGHIFIADASRHIIWVLDSNGTLVEQWGERGTKIGQFAYPLGLCLDAGGKVYIADSDNHRIQIFNTAGDFVGRLQLEQRTCPSDLVVSNAGVIYITDIGGQYLGGDYRVLKYSPR